MFPKHCRKITRWKPMSVLKYVPYMGHRVDDTGKIVRNIVFLKTTLNHYLIISRSICIARGQMRTLWWAPTCVTPRSTRSKLVDIITDYRDLFTIIFVPRDLCDDSEINVLEWSFVTTQLTETFFVIGWLRKPLKMG